MADSQFYKKTSPGSWRDGEYEICVNAGGKWT